MTSNRVAVMRTAIAFFIAVVVALILQVLPFSLRRILIEPPVFTGPELWALECAVGFLNSLAVTAICLTILRRPASYISAASIVAQILWVEWAYGFRQGGGPVMQTFLRYAEHVGIVAGALAAAFCFSWIIAKRHARST